MSKKTTYVLAVQLQETGISNIINHAASNEAIYNMNGQRVMKAQKGGINIIRSGKDSKKVLFKRF
jgi:hypothetical protein